jgi:hypothetical protein
MHNGKPSRIILTRVSREPASIVRAPFAAGSQLIGLTKGQLSQYDYPVG